jgi:hypothetical protein
MENALARIDALDQRLAAIERWAGVRPDLGDIDQEIAQVRRDKEAAIDSQDFESAAARRDKEKELLAAAAGGGWAAATGTASWPPIRPGERRNWWLRAILPARHSHNNGATCTEALTLPEHSAPVEMTPRRNADCKG